MKINSFKLDDFSKEFIRDLRKADERQQKKAAKVFEDTLKTEIQAEGLVDKGDLLKGVTSQKLKGSILAGISSPGYHAMLLEYGTSERTKESTGQGVGRVAPHPFFEPAFPKALPAMQAALSEEWL